MPRPPSLEIALTSPTPAAPAILAGRLFQVLLLDHLTGMPAAGPRSS
jgi:hypothetical protein